ncbi:MULTISPECIES: hypothetical protein [unclassified Gilliamella]|uniref:hypothetical protein n=1 Tax=unclassified Gilliamella TaxID=2685620 RepID=UPI001309270F|nr:MULTISPECIES: hypothetical protein [unclassified Gilliamella]MWN91260.1 hypothetical protein [Gilliamella sp. Pra-s65]MWP48521.1 hypothetical protein [Gilliamella sp. Lep-s35]MWP68583.1 hypothetical protein [Gilliamella sp. Lep-s5]MWP74236.1 hypothetical protein [Gilliamella sp. Pra-s52]MWP76749.1 hypothetical protein [Gilliamella sp. Lep-s21]
MNTIKPFPTRLDDDVRSYLENSSKSNLRSLNSEIAYRLKLTIALENRLACSIDEMDMKINELILSEKYKKLYHEANNKLRQHESTVNSALGLANMNNEKVIKMKTEKALNFISEGLDDLKNILLKINLPEKETKNENNE